VEHPKSLAVVALDLGSDSTFRELGGIEADPRVKRAAPSGTLAEHSANKSARPWLSASTSGWLGDRTRPYSACRASSAGATMTLHDCAGSASCCTPRWDRAPEGAGSTAEVCVYRPLLCPQSFLVRFKPA